MVEARNGWGTGFKPRQPEPESTVLPLDYTPNLQQRVNMLDELIGYQA